MGRILRWGSLQLCQSLVNGLFSSHLLIVKGGNGVVAAPETKHFIKTLTIEYNIHVTIIANCIWMESVSPFRIKTILRETSAMIIYTDNHQRIMKNLFPK